MDEPTQPGRAPPKRRNIDPLTSWRFFAAALVVFYHYSGPALAAWPKGIQRFMDNGYQAVGFFFVLSGFVLVYNYYVPSSPSGMKTAPKRFWLARFARIYPVYALALVAALPPFLWTVHSGKPMSALNLGLTLSATPAVLQAWIPSACLAWNAPAWSLSVEAFFYLLFPWLAFSMGRWNSRTTLVSSLLLATAVAGVLHWIFPLMETGALTSAASNTHHFFAYYPLFHLPTFLVGMALGRAFLDGSGQDASPHFHNTLALASLVLICALFFFHGRVWPVFLSAGITVPAYGVLIYSSARCSGMLRRVLSGRWLVALGEASYALYIVHAPIAWWFGVCLKHFSMRQPLAFFILYFLTAIVASLLIHKYFEIPLKNKCLALFARTSARARGAAIKIGQISSAEQIH